MFEDNMEVYSIKKYLIFAIAILVYSTVVIAAPFPGGSIIEESSVPQNLDLPNKILSSANTAIDKATYDEASAVIRANISSVNSQIKNYTEYKEIVGEKIKRVQKNENLEGIPEENIIKAKELIKSLPQETIKEKVVAEDESVSKLVKDEEYYKALEKLNNILLSKQSQLLEIDKTISKWQQIDILID